MYRYDEFDHAFVRERVSQFREQVERRLAGKLTEDEFRPLRLRNGLYLQLHAYMLRIAIPYGVLSPRQLRQLAMIGRRIGSRLRPFHHAAESAVQLGEARRHSRHACRSGRSRDALHPDQRQLRAQRHRRPVRGGGQRRARGSAALVRDVAPMVDAASRVQLAAAEIQDRRLRRRRGPRRRRFPRHRPSTSCAGLKARTVSACWSAAAWAARPMSARRSGRTCRRSTCSPTSSRSCACTICMAAATICTRRASRSWSISSASTNSARRSRPIGRRRARTPSTCRPPRYARITSYFTPPEPRAAPDQG